MSLTVKILGKSPLEGGGFTGATASNKKVQVFGELTGNYVTNGVVFKPWDIGLDTIDTLSLQIISVNGGTELLETTSVTADYVPSTSVILMATADINGDVTAAVNGQAYICNFSAIGDNVDSDQV